MSNERIAAPQQSAAKPATFNWRFWSASIPVLLVQLVLVYSAAGWTEPVPASSGYQSQAVVAAAPERLPQAAAVGVPIVTPGAALDAPALP